MDLSFASASELVAALADGSLASREHLDHVAARIEATNPALNAVVTLDLDGATAAAAAADDAHARGERLGPLHGLVMTVKDVWETEGLRTTSGAPELLDHVPAADAVAVGRLRAAGAVIVGKTNTPLYAGDFQTFNEPFGRTNNPWDLTRTPGGSSGGAAAAVAAGMTPLELGSDIGGSIRNPAHCCGVYGLKPTWGIVPLRGHIPGPPGSLVETDVNVAGPIARSVADLGLALDVLAGPLPEEAVGWHLALPDDRPPAGLGDLRLAVTLDDPAFPVAGEVQAAVLRGLVDALADAGAKVEEATMPVSMADAVETWSELVLPLLGVGMPEELYEAFAGVTAIPGDPATTSMARLTARFKQRAFANQRRQQQRALWAERFESVDAWLAPCLPVPAFEHDPRPLPECELHFDGHTVSGLDVVGWAGAIGAMLLPAVAVPAGRTPGGLPVGVQIVGPYLGDKRLLRIAALVDEAGPGFTAPPEP